MSRLSFAPVAALVAAVSMCATARAQVNHPVPVLGQRWQPWAGDRLGWGGSGSTIGRFGCGLTSIAMIRSYAAGYTITPRQLNESLKQTGVFSGDLLIWSRTPGYVTTRDYTSVPADLGYIRGVLNSGYLVIAETRLGGSMHFVVLKGFSGDTFYMNDPWYADNPTFNARYGSPARYIYKVHVYKR